MTNLTLVEQARQSLAAAVTRSTEANHESDPDGRAASEHLFAAESKLRKGGREDLGHRLGAVVDDADVTTSEARTEMREVMSKIDAELSPKVAATTAFRAAGDGGGRE
ncbi:hypothetical protein PM023_16160 [Halorubrum ezzemoulense]|uniref:hypothetical protein n=1 Tax=Halorubrum ezzemoulense TaxID=337243 RepID=UPI00232E23BE|nr:hypothetical protein [Halorubrum ezzemoulense]MDB2226181.1 hypothetical protein [Halorubrum ezzemoulense]